jgi:putative transcriptional regulator
MEREIVMESLRGRLLIASPSLVDPNFRHTVVLIAAHGESGAIGLILNRELEVDLADVWRQISGETCARRQKVRHGGPVAGTLMALHDQRPMADIIVQDDLYVATALNAMESLAGSTEGQAQFYVGHSGWGAGQLESELDEGTWLVLPARADYVFGDLDAFGHWKAAATDAGRREILGLVAPRHIPNDPRTN